MDQIDLMESGVYFTLQKKKRIPIEISEMG